MNLSDNDIIVAADRLSCHPAAIKAVILVETPFPHVGDVDSGKPLILNERHWFYKLSGTYPVSIHYPELSNKKPGGYCKGPTWHVRQTCEHKRLKEKMHIYDGVLKEAALKSISMGLFQVMGFNHERVGYNDVFQMWGDALKVDDRIDLEWFVRFVTGTVMESALRNLNWRQFAYYYNGPNYEQNNYHIKLSEYYKRFQNKLPCAGCHIDTPTGFPERNEQIS